MFGFQDGLWNPWGQNFQNPWQQNVFSGFNPFGGGFQGGANPFESLFGTGGDFSNLFRSGGLFNVPAPTPVLPPDINPNAPQTTGVRRPTEAERLQRRRKRVDERLRNEQMIIQGEGGPYRWGAR